MKGKSSVFLYFNVNSIIHANFSDLTKGRRNLRNHLIQFPHCTEGERGSWRKCEIMRTPIGPGLLQRMDGDWLALIVSREHALVDASSEAFDIQLKICRSYIFYPLILFPSTFPFIHSQTYTEHFPCIMHCDKCCKPLKLKITGRNKENGLWRPRSLPLDSYVANINFFSSNMDVTHTLLNG